MARVRSLSSRAIDRLNVEKDTVFWDRELTGFGVRVYASGGKVYVAQARGPDGPKRVTVGRHGVIGAEQARRRTALIIARIKAGEEPVPEPLAAKLANGPTVADLAARFMEDHVAVRCKPKTERTFRSLLDRHVLPALGKVRVGAVGREQAMEFHEGLAGLPTTANMAVKMLSHMFVMAENWGLVPEGTNPWRFFAKYPAGRRERYLTDVEFERLGRFLDEAERGGGGASVSAVAALRLLMLTGCRKGEILTLKWEDVDLGAGELRLADAKTGARTVSLAPEVARVLEGIPRVSGVPWVITGKRSGTYMRKLDDAWLRLRARAGLEDVRIHDLSHRCASRALALGESLPMIGRLLGHREIETTARYAHHCARLRARRGSPGSQQHLGGHSVGVGRGRGGPVNPKARLFGVWM